LATAEALIAAAERVAEIDGPAAVSVRRVADDVGTSTRAVYSVFGSKDGLLVALATRGFDLLAADIQSLPVTADPVEDLVLAGAVVFRGFVTKHPALFRISFQREAVTAEVVARFDDARRAALSQLIARLERLPSAAGKRAETSAQAAVYFHAMCEGLAAIELRGAISPQDADLLWRDGLRALLHGLGGRVSEDAVRRKRA
jgi:AcrR family transcriptional regulator